MQITCSFLLTPLQLPLNAQIFQAQANIPLMMMTLWHHQGLPPLSPPLRGSVRLRPDCQHLISDVRPVSLLCRKRPGNRELLCQPIHLQRWVLFFLVTHNPLCLFCCRHLNDFNNVCMYFSTAPSSSSGMLQGVLLTLSMCLVLLALLVLVLWLHRTGQDGRQRERKEDDDECYNEIQYTPSLMKRSFV